VFLYGKTIDVILKIWRENDPKRRQIIKTLGVVGSQKGKESFII
jgi:hypothetical protein